MIAKLETKHTFAGFSFPRYVPQLPKGKPAMRLGKSSQCGPYYSDPGAEPGQMHSFYLASDFAPGYRWEWADEVDGARIEHQGWFTDEFRDQTIRGVVFRLPHGRGFLAGWSMGESMASAVERTIYESESQAARYADRMAERAAEDQREYEEKERARIEAEEASAIKMAECAEGEGI